MLLLLELNEDDDELLDDELLELDNELDDDDELLCPELDELGDDELLVTDDDDELLNEELEDDSSAESIAPVKLLFVSAAESFPPSFVAATLQRMYFPRSADTSVYVDAVADAMFASFNPLPLSLLVH